MRFPRTNLTDAGDFSSEIETDLPKENPGEKPAAPIWQSNFSLAPNVRFTRTPETLISRRRAPNEPVRDDSQIGQQAIRIEPDAVDVPFDIYLPEPDDISAAPHRVELQQSPLLDEPGAPAFRASAELSSISDFAFWEVMAFEEAEPARAPSLISFPKAEISPESITSLFRIMEWRPGRPAPAPVPSRPAVPPAAVSAKTAVRLPAAPLLERPRRIAVEAPVVLAPQAAPTLRVAPAPQIASAPPAAPAPQRTPPVAAVLPSPRLAARPERIDASGYEFPPRALLQEPPERLGEIMSQETLEQNAGLLESVLEDFGIKGEIIHVRPGPVVTLYEFEPAPGVKSSRVIGLADDIARSMSALSARVAVVPGRNVIGIELPNLTRETVYFREMIESQDFEKSGYKLALGLGKTIGGEPVIAELAKMPHLLVAGTTGSGKSVAINTMILSLLYRMTPEQCRLIMVDPKMLELSVYDGIPHLLTPVVTDPKKAVMALKWAVREMEERYRKMSRLGVRNIDGYNDRVAQAREKGEAIHVMVQVGFDKGTGTPIEESQALDLTPMPYIVVIVDEMADLMMVAGKDIEGAIQRLAQMARAAGIHLIMATQRPSVDVITGTIKANFPTRISFQVTSKIDSRTILGEQGAEQLLGQGDMLHMQGGGRISRVHGPFVSDVEVEKVVAHLKTQGRPEYLDTVTADEEDETEEEEAGAVFDKSAMASEDGNELYEQAVKIVMRDKKCSTSYIQRRLGIGYNRAASLVERMEKEGLVGPANHVGKREIVSGRGDGE
ncbi:DNA translocase FtsK [Rhizobium leguminosarum]|uniref:DNA translocase FtsK n=1 Tax=Rhizobium leguminosarum TaxID=384 RepID=UPI001C985998|nr:DNA translocase FtsK [Rhizobium leguminosarum]MBY5408337.1 DNA translocase FtsK [Rhizobium leguminosarum]